MSRRDNLNEQHPAEETRESVEQDRQRQLEDARPTINTGLKGVERPINDRGDTLFVSDTRPPLDVALERSVTSNERFFLRTMRAGHETGRASASIQIERDEAGYVTRNRTRLHDIEVHGPYRGEEHGDIMLQEIERNARRYASTEVYGLYAASNDSNPVRAFYERNGYRFRPRSDGGEEVYKPLT
jgi:GNAT superfamily N-acetyltransferase